MSSNRFADGIESSSNGEIMKGLEKFWDDRKKVITKEEEYQPAEASIICSFTV